MRNLRWQLHGAHRSVRIPFGLSAAVLLLAGLSAATRAQEQAAPEGDPFRGRGIFEDKGCSRCHSVWGHGGVLGPEITVVVAGKRWDELVGDFWNHTPQMIDEGEKRGYPWPTLDPREMADLLSYLYYLRLFDDLGDSTRGGDAYVRLQCAGCHTLGSHGRTVGGALDRFGAYLSPVPLAQAMWNAGPRMRQEQLRRGSTIPQFTGPEMADLQAYIRSAGHRRGREVSLQPLPDPMRGADVYRNKRCGVCHDTARTRAPDITRSALSKTASEITGLLWNHSYAMEGEMAARGVPFPQFVNDELSDLIAYLYFLGYVGEEGDATRGATVFKEKGCAACHLAGSTSAPDLAAVLQRIDRAGLASAMWNHAPQMHSIMAERASFWPKFEPGEMRDLASYLRRLARSPRDVPVPE